MHLLMIVWFYNLLLFICLDKLTWSRRQHCCRSGLNIPWWHSLDRILKHFQGTSWLSFGKQDIPATKIFVEIFTKSSHHGAYWLRIANEEQGWRPSTQSIKFRWTGLLTTSSTLWGIGSSLMTGIETTIVASVQLLYYGRRRGIFLMAAVPLKSHTGYPYATERRMAGWSRFLCICQKGSLVKEPHWRRVRAWFLFKGTLSKLRPLAGWQMLLSALMSAISLSNNSLGRGLWPWYWPVRVR